MSNPAPNGVAASSMFAMPMAAGGAVVCASTAIAGVVAGMGWLAYVLVAVIVVAGAGIALRALRVPGPLIWVGQVFVLLCLVVTLFTSSGLLGILPGPTAIHDIGSVLGQSAVEIQTGVPPVEGDAPILCLIVLSIGLVAVAVDTLAATARVPAAAGLVLLCVYAVPASLDDQLLPWWSFVAGVGAFTVMLAVDGVQRHQEWRGRLGLPAQASAGVAPAAVAVTAAAVVLSLLIGSAFTLIGTVGRLPGSSANGSGGSGMLGIKPFTELRGMLDRKGTTELFQVSGLPSNPPYLRSVTLSTYRPNEGWVADKQMAAGVPVGGQLPPAPGEDYANPTNRVDVEPVSWDDVWLPVFGDPHRIQGVSTDYHYDPVSGIVYSQQNRHPGHYVEQADLAEPTADQLRSAGTDYNEVDPKYRQANQVSPRVVALAQRITANATTEFDQAQAVYQYFRDPGNGFTYSTQTAAAETSDALVDFLFNGKTGFCEQYASAMGVMMRALGLPTRVVIGFTDGFQSGDHRTITSQDAHAWDEVFFPGYGWITFDPTPLTDGRGRLPSYLNTGGSSSSPAGGGVRNNPGRDQGAASTAPKPSAASTLPIAGGPTQPGGAQSTAVPTWQWWTLGVLCVTGVALTLLARRTRRPAGADADPPPGWLARLVPLYRLWVWAAAVIWGLTVFFLAALVSWWLAALVVILGLAAAPAGVREQRRHARVRTLTGQGPGAADAAWAEVLAEASDRGSTAQRSETLRVAAHRMVREHGLDNEGRDGLRSLVGEVERSWYGVRADSGRAANPAVPDAFEGVRRSLRRNAPLALRAKLLPRSVLQRSRGRSRVS